MQLIARLENEKSENRRLASKLTSREAELAQTKRQLIELQQKAEKAASIVKSLSCQKNTGQQ